MSAPSRDAERDVTALATSAGATVLGRALGRGLHLATMILVARWLGPTAFGVYALAWTVARVAGQTGTLGLELGAIKFGAALHDRPSAHRALVTDVVMLAAIAGLALGGLLVATAGSAGRSFVIAGSPRRSRFSLQRSR
jgi:O-antigen/teichoic acid export membrane protein